MNAKAETKAEIVHLAPVTESTFAVTLKGLDALKVKCSTYNFETKEGYKEGDAARKKVKRMRLDVEARRKEVKQPVLDWGKELDKTAKQLTGLLEDIEDDLTAKKRKVDDERARKKREEREAQERAEREKREAEERARQEELQKEREKVEAERQAREKAEREAAEARAELEALKAQQAAAAAPPPDSSGGSAELATREDARPDDDSGPIGSAQPSGETELQPAETKAPEVETTGATGETPSVPDTTLAALRDYAALILEGGNGPENAKSMAQHFQRLDDHLTDGGDLPSDWLPRETPEE